MKKTKRIITASLCALGLTGAFAGTASADAVDQWSGPFASIQFFNENGLARTLACPTNDAAPECGDFEARNTAVGMGLGTPTDTIGAWRLLDNQGRKLQEGYNNTASLRLVEEIDRTGAPGAVTEWGTPAAPVLNNARAAKSKRGKAGKKKGKKKAYKK